MIGVVSTRRVVALLAVAVVAMLVPQAPAIAEPKIRFISPSPYGGQASAMSVSDKTDKDGAIHLAAWVQEVPASPIVEFEIVPATGNGVTLTATRVGSSDTWETFYDIPGTTSDGAYTFRAILYSNQSQVAVHEQTVTINNSDVPPPQQAETVEMTYPANAGEAGFFTPKGGKPNLVISATTSEGAQQVRGFYTTTRPGNDPVWQSCGIASVSNENTVNLRCTLNGNDGTAAVSAVAVVANLTPPPADPQVAADQSGDAHRVIPYTQVPSQVAVTPPSSKVDVATCTLLTAQVLDQRARPIAGINVDVHATGPSDQLRFGTTSGQGPFKPPDKGAHATENGLNCSNSNASNTQGDHNRPGQDDDKHIESTDNTNNSGRFSFALYADEKGGSTVTVWADPDDDDTLGASEASGGAAIGWGEEPPPPPKQVLLEPASSQANVGSCQKLSISAKQGGVALQNSNVDVHAVGPGSNTSFCAVEGQSPSRAPDQGGHTGNSDPDGAIHLEGETDTSGRFVFGVTSGSEGSMQITVWLENTDDDAQAPEETNTRGEVGWGGRESRTISLNASDRSVSSGSRVRLSGKIDAGDACKVAQTVKLQARRPEGRFRGVGSTETSESGNYSFRRKVSRTTEFRAVAPRTDACNKARSGVKKVRARG